MNKDRAYISANGRWCIYPCQKIGEDGQKIKRECRVPISGFAGPMWTDTGGPDCPTLTPSIDCQSKPCWHGHIVDGVVVP